MLLSKCLGQLGPHFSDARKEIEDYYSVHRSDKERNLSDYEASLEALSDFHSRLFDEANEVRQAAGLKTAMYNRADRKALSPDVVDGLKSAVRDGAFDEARYAKVKPAIEEAFAEYKAEEPMQAMSDLLNALEESGFTEAHIRQMKPYIVRFMRDEFAPKAETAESAVSQKSDTAAEVSGEDEDLKLKPTPIPVEPEPIGTPTPYDDAIHRLLGGKNAVAKGDTISPDDRPERTAKRDTDRGQQEIREPRQPAVRPAQGKETQVRVPDSKTAYKARYALREIEDVIPSHNPVSFQPNPDYHFTNDRHYDQEPQYQEQVRTRSKSDAFDPSQLVNNNPTPETGPPIIDSDGNVLGGNSRSMMLHRIYSDENEGTSNTAANAYRETLRKEADVYGLDPKQIDAMKRPVLVREIDDESVDAQHAITDLNRTSTTPMTQAERSVAEAGKLPDDGVDYIAGRIEATGPDATLTDALNLSGDKIVNMLIEKGVIPSGDRNTLLDGTKITSDGKTRIERLLTGRIFDDLKQYEYAPPYVKRNIQRAVAPLVKTQGDEEWNIIPETREAIDLLTEWKAKGEKQTLEEYAETPSMMHEPWSRAAISVAHTLKGSPNAVSQAFKLYAGEFANAKAGGGLFGSLTQKEAFKTAFGDAGDELKMAAPAVDAFYSQVERTIADKMPNRATAAQVRGILKDTKKEEREWLGIDQWLDEHPNPTKAEVLEFVRENNVQIQEVIHGRKGVESDNTGEPLEWRSIDDPDSDGNWQAGPYEITLHNGEFHLWEDDGTLDDPPFVGKYPTLESAKEAAASENAAGPVEPTKYGAYTLPGGENYRELLLKTPTERRVFSVKEKKYPAQKVTQETDNEGGLQIYVDGEPHRYFRPGSGTSPEEVAQYVAGLEKPVYWQVVDENGKPAEPGPLGKRIYPTKAEAEFTASNLTYKAEQKGYKSSHWDEPNVLAHVRFDDRDGGKTLHIAEIQSDWHQAGKKDGYASTPSLSPVQLHTLRVTAMDALKRNDDLGFDSTPAAIHAIETHADWRTRWEVDAADVPAIEEFRNQLETVKKGGVPDAPFKKSWPLLAMKRMIRYAAEHGYESISWDTGETQAERYDLSKHVDSVRWRRVANDSYRIEINKGGRDLAEQMKMPEVIPGSKIPDYLGKDAAELITKSDTQSGILRGDDLKVGGSGMRVFYDKMLPNEVNGYVKKWGARVEDVGLSYSGVIPADARVVGEGTHARIWDVAGNEYGPTFKNESDAKAWLDKYREERSHSIPVHSLTITPSMHDAAMAGQSLFQFPSSERAADLQKYARITKFEDEHLNEIAPTVKGDVITPDLVSHELMRTAKAIVSGRSRESAGLSLGYPLEPNEVEKLTTFFNRAGDIAQEHGLSRDGFDKITSALTEAAKAKDGRVAWALPEAKRHERIHVADARGAVDAEGVVKDFETRYDGATDELKSDADFQEFHGSLNELQGTTSHGAAMAEALAWLGDGRHEDFGLSEGQAVNILASLVNGYAKENGVEALANFDQDTKIYEVINETRTKGTGSDIGDESGLGSDSERQSQPEDSADESGRDDQAEQKPAETDRGESDAGDEVEELDFRPGDRIKDLYGRKGTVFADKDGTLHVEQDGTKARLPLSGRWELAKPRPIERNGLKKNDVVSNPKGQVGKVYERGGQLRVKYRRNDKTYSEPLSDKWSKASNTEAGAVSADLLTLGLNKTLSDDVVPTLQSVVNGIKSSADDIRRLVFAGGRGEAAKLAGGSLREALARSARSFDIATEALKSAREYFAHNPVEDNYDFIGKIEGGSVDDLPDSEKPIAQELRRLLDEARERVQALGKGKLESFIENYFPHIWKDPKQAESVIGQILGKRPFEGSKNFLKKRTIETFADGLEAGLEPISDNPVDLALLKIREMNRYIAAHEAMNELKANGLVELVKIGQPVPDGFAKINDKISAVQYSNEKGEMVIAGNYYAAESAAVIINNHLSPGLRERSSAYRGFLAAGNLMNQFQLGFSAFHLGFTSVDAAVSKLALGLNQMTSGHPIKGIQSAISSPIAPVANIIRGNRLMREWLVPNSTDPVTTAIAELLEKAGGRVKMDDFYHTGMARKMLDAYKRGNILGGIIRTPTGAVDLATRPILEYIVPRQKLGVFADLAKHEVDRLGPDATPDQIREAMGRIWDTVDNRMGQLVYDNLFWNKVVKDLAMGSVRSVGWNLGTLRELGGAVNDTITLPLRVRDAMKGEKSVKPIFTYRMAYAVALPTLVGIMGAVMTYLMTGDPPKELKDYYFPRTGNLDESGDPERLSLPSYIKDVYAYYEHPGRTLGHKLHPLLGLISEMLTNKDYYNTQIRNVDDPIVQQLEDVALHVGKAFVPFAVSGVLKENERGGSKVSKLLPFIGITPAPADINTSDAEDLLAAINNERYPKSVRTKAEAEKARVMRGLVREVRLGNNIKEEFDKAKEAGLLTDNDLRTIKERSSKTYLQSGVSRLGVDDAARVFAVATDEERQILRDAMEKKMRNAAAAGKLSPERQQQLTGLGLRLADEISVPPQVQKEFEKFDMKLPDVGEDLTLQKHQPKTHLDFDQYNKYRSTALSAIYERLGAVVDSPEYQQADDAEKEVMLQRIVRKQRMKALKSTKRELATQPEQ